MYYSAGHDTDVAAEPARRVYALVPGFHHHGVSRGSSMKSLPAWPTGGRNRQHDVFSATAGQTVFSLSLPTTTPSYTEVSINGVEAEYLIDFTVSNSTVTWIGSYVMAAGDSVAVDYVI